MDNIFHLHVFQMQDILKFGVDTLLNDDDSTDADIDFIKILGPSVNGEWQLDEEASISNDQEVLVFIVNFLICISFKFFLSINPTHPYWKNSKILNPFA